MSLNWSITDIKDWQQVSMADENGLEGTKTNALVWACMTVDLPGITAKNVDEWVFRLSIVEKYRGAFIWRTVNGQQEDYLFTREDVVRRIGLSTNVSTKTRTAWLTRMAEAAAYDVTGPDGARLTPAARAAEKARLLKEMKALAPKKAA